MHLIVADSLGTEDLLDSKYLQWQNTSLYKAFILRIQHTLHFPSKTAWRVEVKEKKINRSKPDVIKLILSQSFSNFIYQGSWHVELEIAKK